MRLQAYITEAKDVSRYKNWVFPTTADMKSDFAEYKAKEFKKWEGRARTNGFRFPIFDDYNNYVKTLKAGKVVTLDGNWDSLAPSSLNRSIQGVKDMVSHYGRPRDVDRIVRGFENNEKIPYPVFLKGSRGTYRLSGNTRTDIAKQFGIDVKILVVDVSD